MDDSLEKPTAISQPSNQEEREEEDQSSGDEDQGPDWTKLPYGSISRPVIPKRGEKEFEPSTAGGSGLQRHVLDRARSAMLDALSAPRTISSKSISYGVWYPEIARTHVTLGKGIHFATMGHSVARASTEEDDAKKVQKRLELLPEEALYLVERGGMLCWKSADLSIAATPGLDDVEGVPMTVQQAFAEMIGKEDLTLEKYQVFAYLKRLGYSVTRAKPPTPEYPSPPALSTGRERPTSVFARIRTLLLAFWRLLHLIPRKLDWWRPLRRCGWLNHMDNRSIFSSLRFLPSGHDVPLHVKGIPGSLLSPYEIFFNLYKPSTPFKKTAPPPPDFSVVVVNARTTPMPSLTELTNLFGTLPELSPPIPRKRQSFAQQKAAAANTPPQAPPPPVPPPPVASEPLLQRLLPWFFPPPPTGHPARNPNPFLSLKTGKKMIVIAAVDAGTISFFRFGQGVFTEWSMA
ncbi:hypothetical protein WOLCODRAFT_66993 [Wolfiporia cocos MD-104 SS10]|uniref:tRNA-splicing endonuclease subunit Sen54 N-terminal domain-containing protein n=1 Tax=Wolfiporia cocos (strain MD-104) TaxID=742152 RepID=A0A2H3JPY0_WOLCO|nr:hypothetical protein WOLCODRAFT_66993 [Wolfiporia cocos MD-104 SS10]